VIAERIRTAVAERQEALAEFVDAKPGPVMLPVFRPPPPGSLVACDTYEPVRLDQRRYAMPAPWAIREFRYIANVLVHPSEPDTPLVYGEWKLWYRNPEFMDPEIPAQES
jgi:hypothetical protein